VESDKNIAINITSLDLGSYRVRVLPLSVNDLTLYYVTQQLHFFNGVMLPCNYKNNEHFGRCIVCNDTWQLYKNGRQEEAKKYYARDVYFSTMANVDSKGNIGESFVLKYSRQLHLKFEHAITKFGSICEPSVGYFFDIVIKMKDEKRKWRTYDDSEAFNGQPFPVTGLPWQDLLLTPSVNLVPSLPFNEGKAFYLEHVSDDSQEGYANPAFAKSANEGEVTSIQHVTQEPPVREVTPIANSTSRVGPIPTTKEAPWTEKEKSIIVGNATIPPPCHSSIPGKPGYVEGDRVCNTCNSQETCRASVRPMTSITPITPIDKVKEMADLIVPTEPVKPKEPVAKNNAVYPNVDEVSEDVKAKLTKLKKK
jgi:hypothetical protein